MILSSSSLSAVTTAPSIFEDIDFLAGTSSVSYPFADKLRNVNLRYNDVVSDILKAQSNWEFDDTNTTDYPIATTTLVAGQLDYALPSSFLKLLRVEVKDSAGNFQRVYQFDETQVSQALSEFDKTNGLPIWYRELANSIELYPQADASSVTLTNGLRCYFQRNITEFTTSDASVTPGFAQPFHRILSIGAAYDYAFAKQLPVANALKVKLDEMRLALMQYYSSRNREVRPKLQTRIRNYD